jgi:hypothetical protein
MRLLFWRKESQSSNEPLQTKEKKKTADKLIEAVESELTDAERRIAISKAKIRPLILRIDNERQ